MRKKFCLLSHYELEDFLSAAFLFADDEKVCGGMVRAIKYVNSDSKPEHKDAIV